MKAQHLALLQVHFRFPFSFFQMRDVWIFHTMCSHLKEYTYEHRVVTVKLFPSLASK